MKTKILICMGTSGLSAGAEKVESIFKSELKRHKLTDKCEIVRTGDRGLFRDVLVDIITPELGRVTYEYIKPSDVPELVEKHLVSGEPVKKLLAGKDYEQFFAGQMRIVLSNCGEIDPENIDDYLSHGGYSALKKVLGMAPEKVIEEIKKSGLRGRGGAGFPTGRKWELCRAVKSNEKYVICNADEGDPGAFMDRSVLEGDPHSVIEGMIIAGYAIGASHGYVYCRAEYPLAVQRINKAISQAKEKSLLGKSVLGSTFSFDIRIKEGAGAFVCGEETALIASIEGNRGMPRPRPPFPVEKGLWDKPTVINNVETLAAIRHLVTKGAGWFAAIGTEKSKGTKVFALAGKVKNTGLVEVPMGTTIRELIFGPGGGMVSKRLGLKAVQIGGPSGGCLPESLLDTPIDYESITQTGAIMGSGGMIVMDERACMVDMAKFFINFTVAESCGKCVPCRVGLKRMLEVIDAITEGKGREEHIKFLQEMSGTIKSTALCGLGNTAPNPVLTTLKYFRDEYEAHVKDRICPSHACSELLKYEVIESKCVKCGQCYKACPVDAIRWRKKEYAVIDKDKCIKCKACFNACEFMAIQ
ncbi:MAG: NADH-ubiquinone oxidoreductase-F iron-sulfur binding region domain-containing protein [Phycisphaerae bacterium]|nr:NADH-ubiquinone oxidoreductase-F iron-sulfur binding region domain-containing protein [Phycisphaerae bacterium]MDD5380026.1 NADH-ubiquinone oxidoreductase-F iron-sulfur binding region domain-containing protein [Phycisphaerae bacterium]